MEGAELSRRLVESIGYNKGEENQKIESFEYRMGWTSICFG